MGGLGVVAGGGSGFGYSLSGAGFGYAITGFLAGFIAEKERMRMFRGNDLIEIVFRDLLVRTLCGFCEPARQVAAQPSKQQ